VAQRIAIGRERRDDVNVVQRQRKPRRKDADDHERLAIDAHSPADRVSGAAEAPLPQAVTDDDNVRRIGAIVALVQQASSGRRQAEHVERIRRHPRALEPFGHALARQAGAPIRVRCQTRERAGLTSVVHELW
jgi:hypothetical protein